MVQVFEKSANICVDKQKFCAIIKSQQTNVHDVFGGIFMTTLTLFKALIEICVILLVCVGIYNEKSFIRFERKAAKFIKCFFKACVLTLKEKQGKRADVQKSAEIMSIDSKRETSAAIKTKKTA